ASQGCAGITIGQLSPLLGTVGGGSRGVTGPRTQYPRSLTARPPSSALQNDQPSGRVNAASLMKIFESLGWQTSSDDVTRNRHQLSSRTIMSGFTINARRADRTLATVTTPANAIVAASHTHKPVEPLPPAMPLIHREHAKDT